jgi:lipopolysaccharide biosynthesis glycosyltransferase
MHVALAVDRAYLPWSAVAALSCVDHGGPDVTIHVLHDGSLDRGEDIGRLSSMVEAAGGTLVDHVVDDQRIVALPSIAPYGRVVWLRFLLPEVLPEVSRVLYIDADTLVVSDPAPLMGADLGGAPLGAVANVVYPEHRAHLRALGFDDYRRFLNSGVLLFDLDRFRAEGISESLLAVARDRAADLQWPDQDVLNLVFAERWHALDPRWNAQQTLWIEPALAADVLGAAAADEARASPGILHFEGPDLAKPWHTLNTHPWRGEWRATLARTPWRGIGLEDRSLTTMLLRAVPERTRVRAYRRLLRWRGR